MNAATIRHTLRSLLLLSLALAGAGCSMGSSSHMASTGAVLRVTPADGASGVRLDASVSVDLGVPVDRGVVEDGLHLIAESEITGTCADPAYGRHGGMDSVMANPDMLRHMDARHAMAGRYHWNAGGTTCTFTPDSLMRPQSRYMVHMGGSLVQMMQHKGGSMMGGTMNRAGDRMVHFQTMAAELDSGRP